MLSPTTATVESPSRKVALLTAPSQISRANSLFSTSQAFSASLRLTPSEIPVSEEDWQGRNTLIWLSAREPNMLLSSPTTPTIIGPPMFIRQVSSMEEIPVIDALLLLQSCLMTVPAPSGLKVLRTLIGMFLD